MKYLGNNMSSLLHPWTYSFIVQNLRGIPSDKWNELEIIKRLYELSYFYDIPIRYIERTFPAALLLSSVAHYTTISTYLAELPKDEAIRYLEEFKEEQSGPHRQWVIRESKFYG